jgi:lysyl-tRNA synthetase class 2
MNYVAVQSTTLAAVAYDADRRLLRLRFRDRKIYQYSDVPGDVHEALLRAPSKGLYFNRFIRGRFAFHRPQDLLNESTVSLS